MRTIQKKHRDPAKVLEENARYLELNRRVVAEIKEHIATFERLIEWYDYELKMEANILHRLEKAKSYSKDYFRLIQKCALLKTPDSIKTALITSEKIKGIFIDKLLNSGNQSDLIIEANKEKKNKKFSPEDLSRYVDYITDTEFINSLKGQDYDQAMFINDPKTRRRLEIEIKNNQIDKEQEFAGIHSISHNFQRVIIFFRILDQSCMIFFVFPTGELHLEEIKGVGRNEISELFDKKWFNPYQQWKAEALDTEKLTETIGELLNVLYEKLMVHVRRVLKEKSTCKDILLVTNHYLALLPLHAASWKGKTGRRRYFLEEYTISYAPSMAVFKRCQKNDKDRSDKTLFVTNPSCNQDSSEQEVLYIQRIHKSNNNLLRKQATKAEVTKELLKDYGFTHFSCHGLYNREKPFESCLMMSDGMLNLIEILNFDLQNNWLTTLSACETGMVDFDSPTEEHFGLPLGFIFAGSPSVWASLWSVSDMATAELMRRAYKKLSHKKYKNNKPEALRRAQLEMLRDRDSTNPFFWAGFQHFGV